MYAIEICGFSERRKHYLLTETEFTLEIKVRRSLNEADAVIYNGADTSPFKYSSPLQETHVGST